MERGGEIVTPDGLQLLLLLRPGQGAPIVDVDRKWGVPQDGLDRRREVAQAKSRPQDRVPVDQRLPGGKEFLKIKRPIKGAGQLIAISRAVRPDKRVTQQSLLRRRQRIDILDIVARHALAVSRIRSSKKTSTAPDRSPARLRSMS